VRLLWLAHDEAPGPYITISQYWFNKTKQHTHSEIETISGLVPWLLPVKWHIMQEKVDRK